MNWDTVNAAIAEARETQRLVQSHSTSMARLLIGNLRKVDDRWVLKALKHELQGFDLTTKRWKR